MPVKVKTCKPAFCATVTLAMGSRVGGGGGETVTLKVWVEMLLLLAPLLRVTIIVAEPVALGMGLKVSEAVVLVAI